MATAKLLASVVAALALAAPAAARPVAQAPLLHGALAGFGGDPHALPDAVTALERRGGRVAEIRFDSRHGRPAFDAVVARGGVVSFVRAPERRGEIATVIRKAEAPRWMLGWHARRELTGLQRADVPLATAVWTVERNHAGAPAVAAGVATLASDPLRPAPVYNVLLEQPDGRLLRTAVDARTGLEISDVRPYAEWPKDRL
jgi:hypothetical protein